LKSMGYQGPVAMEAHASGDAEKALDAFRAAFTSFGDT
jgi:hydroxypyruvate isomerase